VKGVGVVLAGGLLGGCFNLSTVDDCALPCDDASDCPADYACNQGYCAANAGIACAEDPPVTQPGAMPDASFEPIPRGDGGAPAPDASPADAGLCGEAACVAVFGAYNSHFNGAGCTGIESYYTPYFNSASPPMPNPDGRRYSWDGGGVAGTEYRTVTNRSWRGANGVCHDDWPEGSTLAWFVTLYR
jgi:hypothetical protein